MNHDNKDLIEGKTPKPRWWYLLWSLTVILMIVFGVILYLLIPTSLIIVLLSEIVGFIVLGFAYYIRVRPSIKVNKIVYTVFGITPIGFVFAVIYILTGIPRLLLNFLGSWGSWLSLVFIVILCVIGGFIGNWIGKKREYRLPLSP